MMTVLLAVLFAAVCILWRPRRWIECGTLSDQPQEGE
jgi:hypothetical protein